MGATNGAFWTQTFLKTDGTPYVGVRVFHYVAGATTTNLDVYQNGDLTAPHNNPVVGDASGRVSFYGNGTYRLQVRTSTADGNITLYDWDPVELVHHTATLRAEDKAISLPSASSAARGRLFGTVDGGGDILGLWVQRTAAAWQQLLTLPTLSQMLEIAKGSTIASTTNVTVPSDGNFFDISGTNSIETFSGFTGYPVIYTRTLSALTFVHSANLVLQGAANRTSLANQVTAWLHIGSGQWMELAYTNPFFGDGSLTDGAVLVGNGQAAMTELALPTVNRVLGHSGTAGQDPSWLTGLLYHGPTSIGTGSTRSHEGNVTISGNQSLSGIHFYTNFTLNAGVTVTLPAGSKRLIIVASDSISISGAIAAQGAGGTAGTAGSIGLAGGDGGAGTDQPGGGGQTSGATGGLGGAILQHGVVLSQAPVGTSGTQMTGSSITLPLWDAYGGSGGGGGGSPGAGTTGAGGAGGGSVTLIAPSITLSNTATINTSGSNGVAGAGGAGSGSGGGAGNVRIVARFFTDNGAVFTQTGGTGAANGAAGVKQINIYG